MTVEMKLEDMTRREFTKGGLASLTLLSLGLLFPAEAESIVRIRDSYSPRNSRRAIRPSTDYIILHTTEAGDRSSYNSTRNQGTCHYLVMSDGEIHRIIDKSRIATHAGRSMWNGRSNLSNSSLGIEVVGTYKRPVTNSQLRSFEWLVGDLQRIYKIPDKNVLTHSQVAYGWNKWAKKNVRGRRKDAVQFADPEIRRRIGLTDQWSYDPDERAGRISFLNDAEGRWLENALYNGSSNREAARAALSVDRTQPGNNVIRRDITAWTIAGNAYNASTTTYHLPDGTVERGNNIKDWNRIPTGTIVKLHNPPEESVEEEGFEGFREIGVDGDTVWSIAGNQYLEPTTIYFFPDGRVRQGSQLIGSPILDNPPKGLKLLLGYVYGGHLSGTSRTAYDVAGKEWNYPSTLYRLPTGEIQRGDEVRESELRKGTLILFRQ